MDNLQHIQAAFSLGKYDKALEMIHEAMSSNPDVGFLHFLAGCCLYHKKHFDHAEHEFCEAIRLDEDVDHYRLLSATLVVKKQYPQALACAKKAVELDPESEEAYVQLAEVFFVSEKYQQSYQSLLIALELDPYNEEAQLLLANTISHIGDSKEAISLFESALEVDPNNAYAHSGLGAHHLMRGDKSKALEHYPEAVREDPSEISFRNGYSLALMAKNKIFGFFWSIMRLISRQKKHIAILIIALLWLGVIALNSIQLEYPELSPWLAPVFYMYIAFCLFSWFSEPLFTKFIEKGWVK